MRLLHSETLQFREFFERDVPKYAILSHRWGDKEVSFQEMEQNRVSDGPGIEKINGCCRQACQDGLEWVWVDTCCIDKKSSAELTEAINSMFGWYGSAKVCFVYLSDVTSPDKTESLRQFERSQWFTRGWTLQELLAPQHSIFFNAMWEPIGTKEDLSSCLAGITNIDTTLLGTDDVERALKGKSVAQRMSWAATRVTTRIEDEAYCLLGIFDINMPLLYGEGVRAFRRLQLEIIKESNDESIFAWGLDVARPHHMEGLPRSMSGPYSVLAASPQDFLNCKLVYKRGDTRTFAATNLGLKIRVPKQALSLSSAVCGPTLNLELHCIYPNQQGMRFGPLLLHLHQFGDTWQRQPCSSSNGVRYEEYALSPRSHQTNDEKVYLNISP